MKRPREPATTKVLLHTVQQACAALNIGVTKLYEEIAAGRLAAVKDGRNTKIPELVTHCVRRGVAGLEVTAQSRDTRRGLGVNGVGKSGEGRG